MDDRCLDCPEYRTCRRVKRVVRLLALAAATLGYWLAKKSA